jgi:hypothetical protein
VFLPNEPNFTPPYLQNGLILIWKKVPSRKNKANLVLSHAHQGISEDFSIEY